MGAQTKITLTHDVAEVAGDLQSKGMTAQNGGKQHNVWLQNLLNRIAHGASNATLSTVIDDGTGAAASGTFTFSAAATANDTVLINGVTFTAVASGATGNQWNVGSSATQTAANLAAAIVGSATALVNLHVTASANAGVVTITSLFSGANGPAGNAVTIAKGTDAGSVNTVSGARLTGGTASGSSSSVTYKFGL